MPWLPAIVVPTLLAEPLTAETNSTLPSGSVSLASTPVMAVVVNVPSSDTEPVSATAVGASLTATTLIVAVATLLPSAPSLTVTWMVRGVVSGFSELFE